MTQEEIRKLLSDKIREKGFAMRKLSIDIGKHGTYLFKFITLGTPRALDEFARKKLAYILDIDEQDLSETPLMYVCKKDTISIDMLDATACCGNGIETLSESVVGRWLMPLNEFKSITLSAPENVKLLPVKGDSMQPTIKDGDWVFVDITRTTPDSDGMFLLRLSTGLAVKRIQGGLTDNIIIKSDNKKYNDLTASVGEVTILGKVIYILKAEKVG